MKNIARLRDLASKESDGCAGFVRPLHHPSGGLQRLVPLRNGRISYYRPITSLELSHAARSKRASGDLQMGDRGCMSWHSCGESSALS
jgi:hypothetical protein